MDSFERRRKKIIDLFEEVDENDEHNELPYESDTESEHDPFSDDGEYAGDPTYQPPDEESDSEVDDLGDIMQNVHVEVRII